MTPESIRRVNGIRCATLSLDAELLARRLLKMGADRGWTLLVTDALRTQAEQDALFAKGRTRPGPIVTWTRESRHLSGEAFDVTFVVDGAPRWDARDPWSLLGTLGEALGLTWGGRWKRPDRPHFEVPHG